MIAICDIPVETAFKSFPVSNYETVMASLTDKSSDSFYYYESSLWSDDMQTKNVSTLTSFIRSEITFPTWGEISNDIFEHYTSLMPVKSFKIRAKIAKINTGYKPKIQL